MLVELISYCVNRSPRRAQLQGEDNEADPDDFSSTSARPATWNGCHLRPDMLLEGGWGQVINVGGWGGERGDGVVQIPGPVRSRPSVPLSTVVQRSHLITGQQWGIGLLLLR